MVWDVPPHPVSGLVPRTFIQIIHCLTSRMSREYSWVVPCLWVCGHIPVGTVKGARGFHGSVSMHHSKVTWLHVLVNVVTLKPLLGMTAIQWTHLQACFGVSEGHTKPCDLLATSPPLPIQMLAERTATSTYPFWDLPPQDYIGKWPYLGKVLLDEAATVLEATHDETSQCADFWQDEQVNQRKIYGICLCWSQDTKDGVAQATVPSSSSRVAGPPGLLLPWFCFIGSRNLGRERAVELLAELTWDLNICLSVYSSAHHYCRQ